MGRGGRELILGKGVFVEKEEEGLKNTIWGINFETTVYTFPQYAVSGFAFRPHSDHRHTSERNEFRNAAT